MNESNNISQTYLKNLAILRNQSLYLFFTTYFQKSKFAHDIFLNAHYVFVFKNPSDKLQIQHLGRQIMPLEDKSVVHVFEGVSKKKLSIYYLI